MGRHHNQYQYGLLLVAKSWLSFFKNTKNQYMRDFIIIFTIVMIYLILMSISITGVYLFISGSNIEPFNVLHCIAGMITFNIGVSSIIFLSLKILKRIRKC